MTHTMHPPRAAQGRPAGQVRRKDALRVVDGVIEGLADVVEDGRPSRLAIWDQDGTVPTAVVGRAKMGKSNAGRLMALMAGSVGANAIVIDPLGTDNSELARRACVVLHGPAAARRAPEVVDAIVRARTGLRQRTGGRPLTMGQVPFGLTVLHEDFGAVSDDVKVASAWADLVAAMQELAMWPVAINERYAESRWGGDWTRKAFSRQVVAFDLLARSENELTGLDRSAPRKRVQGEMQSVPGLAAQGRPGQASQGVRWEQLGADEEAAAFDEYFRPRALDPLDVEAIESVLGAAVRGRWVVGAASGTHQFPPIDGQPAQALSSLDRAVLLAIEDGATNVTAVTTAVRPSRVAVQAAVTRLERDGLVIRSRGKLAPADTGADAKGGSR